MGVFVGKVRAAHESALAHIEEKYWDDKIAHVRFIEISEDFQNRMVS